MVPPLRKCSIHECPSWWEDNFHKRTNFYGEEMRISQRESEMDFPTEGREDFLCSGRWSDFPRFTFQSHFSPRPPSMLVFLGKPFFFSNAVTCPTRSCSYVWKSWQKITDKIFIKVAGLIQRYVKISWLFSLNRLSLLRISHKTLSQSADWFLLWGYVRLPYSIWRVVKRWLKISLQELFVCKKSLASAGSAAI